MIRLRYAGLAGLAVLSLAGAAHAQAKPPVMVRAEDCLRKNVDRVVADDADMASAATFLVTYACAAEVASAARFERNSAYVQMFATIFKSIPQPATAAAAGKPPTPAVDFKASVDPETGELITPPATTGAPVNPISTLMPMMDGLFGQVAPATTPLGLRKLAGELVMAARERRGAKPR